MVCRSFWLWGFGMRLRKTAFRSRGWQGGSARWHGAAMFCGRSQKERLFFFEKKNQKTFL
jgi:hypothetical protein